MLSLVVLTVLVSAVNALALLPRDTPSYVEYPVESCSGQSDSQYFSCNAPGTVSSESCCYENYGIIMQTQFWDYDTSLLDKKKREMYRAEVDSGVRKRASVEETFTIHGLWDDLCDGSYKQFCNADLEFTSSDDIEDVLVNQFGRQDLYDFMLQYWISNTGGDLGAKKLWVHEYNKHGTCFNTLQPRCFTGDYEKFENAVAFFQKVIEVWTNLPTYSFLSQAGITPTADSQYALSDVQAALAAGHDGKQVYVGCTSGAISEIWYYHEVKGNVLNGQYKAIDTLTDTTCPDQVWYLPK